MDGKKLDAILNLLPSYIDGVQAYTIKEKLFPDLNIDQIDQLILQIERFEPNISEIEKGVMGIVICQNGLTENFLKEGGFTEMEKNLLLEKKALKEKNDLEFKKSKLDLKLAKKNLKEFPKIKLRANIGLGIAIFLAIVQIIQWIIELSSKYF